MTPVELAALPPRDLPMTFAHLAGFLPRAQVPALASTIARRMTPPARFDAGLEAYRLIADRLCQSARKRDPGSASNRDPLLVC